MKNFYKIFRAPEQKENAGASPDTVKDGAVAFAPTPEQASQWKQDHPQGIYGFEIDGRAIVFKKPNIDDLNYSWSRNDPMAKYAMFKALSEVTWIGGDKTLLNDEQAMIKVYGYQETMDIGKPVKLLNL